MNTIALTKTSSKGNQVTVYTDGARCRVELDGRDLGVCGGPVKVRTSAGLVWILDVKPAIGLTDAEAAAVEAAMSAALVQRQLSLPEQRLQLVDALREAIARYGREREAAFEADLGQLPADTEIETAYAALKAFDAAHPEIAAAAAGAADAERAARIRAGENA